MLRLRLDWIDRDGKLLILAGGVQAFALGYLAHVLPDYLRALGSSAIFFGFLLSAGAVGGLLFTLVIIIIAERVGRRRMLVLVTLMASAAGAGLALTGNYTLLLAFAFLGAMGRGNAGLQPTRPLWQASLTDTAPPNKRTDLFAVYYIALFVAGFLGSTASTMLEVSLFDFGFSEILKLRAMIVVFVVLLLVVAFLYNRVSSAVEAPTEARKPVNPFKLPSRRVIFTLSGLLGLNTLAAAVILQSVAIHSIINWSEEERWDTLIVNVWSSFLSAVLVIPALWLAAKIANRFGLVKTLVFTQMSAALFVIPVAFVPAVGLSVLFRMLYSVLGRMSTPLRASYIMAVVAPEERVAMAGIVILGITFLEAVGSLFGAVLTPIVPVIIPLFAGAALAIASNLALYRMFRHVKPPEEAERAASDT